MSHVLQVDSIRRLFGERAALDGVSFDLADGETLALLGPNGSGKTTLFRILSTLLAPTSGRAVICGHDVRLEQHQARSHIGVVFQSPSLDLYLTVRENLRHGGHLYGLRSRDLEARIDEALEALCLADRAGDLVRVLSGGMRRRVEIAKGLLHRPALLLLDEPSTGLDPAARRQLWEQLLAVRQQAGVSVLLTTHLMDEADACDRVAILDRGRLIALDAPATLKRRLGGDCITISTRQVQAVSSEIQEKLGCRPTVVDGALQVETKNADQFIGPLLSMLGDRVDSVSIRKPTLEDVFLRETGHRFEAETSELAAA